MEVRLPIHWCTSVHFFSEISYLRLARNHDRSTPYTSIWAEKFSHSTLQVSSFSIHIFTHLSTFSLLVTPLYAGYHRTSMTISGLTQYNVAMCFRIWRAYYYPEPDLSNVICLRAACASEKTITRSEVVCYTLVQRANSSMRMKEIFSGCVHRRSLKRHSWTLMVLHPARW